MARQEERELAGMRLRAGLTRAAVLILLTMQILAVEMGRTPNIAEAVCADNVNAATFAQGTQLLKNTVLACVGGTPFSMPAEGVQLLSGSIPNDFHVQNAQRALVEVEYTVTQSSTSTSWSITIDVDNATTGARPQRAHYGYTIYGRNPNVGRVTGHIFFPQGVYPPHVRPPLGTPNPYTTVSFTTTSSRFTLAGVNRFLRSFRT